MPSIVCFQGKQGDRGATAALYENLHGLRRLLPHQRDGYVFADSNCHEVVVARICAKRVVQSGQDLGGRDRCVEVFWRGHYQANFAASLKHRSVRQEPTALAHEHLRHAEQRLGQGLNLLPESSKKIVHLTPSLPKSKRVRRSAERAKRVGWKRLACQHSTKHFKIARGKPIAIQSFN